MPRPQFTLRALLVAVLVVAAFFGGIHFERERRHREDEAALAASHRPVPMLTTPLNQFVPIAAIDPSYTDRVGRLLEMNGIESIIEGSVVYGVSVPAHQQALALSLLRADAAVKGYWTKFE